MKALIVALVLFLLAGCAGGANTASEGSALQALSELPGLPALAPNYKREAFGVAWKDVDHNGCDTRSDVMRRDIHIFQTKEGTHGCVVYVGELYNVYIGKLTPYTRGPNSGVEVDHVVSLEDGWQTGMDAQPDLRVQFANDPLNLITTDKASNRTKSAKNAAEWLVPDNPGYRCEFAARQVAVKKKYRLGVTEPERRALFEVLFYCDDQPLTTEAEVATPRAFPIGEPRR